MVPDFYLSSLTRKVEALGKAYPVPRRFGPGSVPVVTCILATGEEGHIMWQICIHMRLPNDDWVVADVLASYSFADQQLCELDALLLADYWSLRLYHASQEDGFCEIENVAEIAKEVRFKLEGK